MEEQPKITTTTSVEKVKDPRRVAAGKRLAAISKQAKERKRKEREANDAQPRHEVSEDEWVTTTTLSIPVIGAVIAIGGYLYWYRSKSKPEPKVEPPAEVPTQSTSRSPSKIPVRKLEKL